MSTDSLRAFLAKLETDADLQDKLKAAADMDAATSIAKEAVFDISK
jgi:predicted ribosomally synthesized peptide with nif11-like leader